MMNLTMVQDALRHLGETTAEAIAAFVWQYHRTWIEPRFIPVYRASLRDQDRRDATRQAARASAGPAVADAPPARRMISGSARATAARQLALALMAQHRLAGWTFRFNRCKQALGLCVYQRRTIELSIYLVERDNPLEEIRDTILHEIAHALVGPRHGHDKVWKRKCLEIGARPLRCGLADMPPGRWQASCGGCGKRFHRYRKPKRLSGWFCRGCGSERGQLVWRQT
jgi:predicted SprT family Zn-dependent metalloprotease